MDTLSEKIPRPKVEHIKVLEVKKVLVPHPYCITPRHLTGKSMYLDQEAIRDAEKNNGAVCDICKKLVRIGRQTRVFSVDEHSEEMTLFLEVPEGDLNAILGLKEYLLQIKPILIELGVDGVAFQQVKAEAEAQEPRPSLGSSVPSCISRWNSMIHHAMKRPTRG